MDFTYSKLGINISAFRCPARERELWLTLSGVTTGSCHIFGHNFGKNIYGVITLVMWDKFSAKFRPRNSPDASTKHLKPPKTSQRRVFGLETMNSEGKSIKSSNYEPKHIEKIIALGREVGIFRLCGMKRGRNSALKPRVAFQVLFYIENPSEEKQMNRKP